jgi:hypothetical protein
VALSSPGLRFQVVTDRITRLRDGKASGLSCRGFDVARPHPLRAQDEAWNGLKT